MKKGIFALIFVLVAVSAVTFAFASGNCCDNSACVEQCNGTNACRNGSVSINGNNSNIRTTRLASNAEIGNCCDNAACVELCDGTGACLNSETGVRGTYAYAANVNTNGQQLNARGGSCCR